MLTQEAILVIEESLARGKVLEIKTEKGKVLIIELGKRQILYRDNA